MAPPGDRLMGSARRRAHFPDSEWGHTERKKGKKKRLLPITVKSERGIKFGDAAKWVSALINTLNMKERLTILLASFRKQRCAVL